ncbi:MAG TPA: hypothetical protein VGB03_06595 [Acidimicrobiales bacterium]
MPPPRLLAIALRVAWAVLPFTVGSAAGDLLDGRSAAVRLAAAVVLWAGWATTLVAVLVPHPVSLTAVRVAAPAAMAVAVAAAVDGSVSAPGLLGGVVVVALAFVADIGELFVNGPAYPNERRYPLRPPGPVLLGTVELAWALAVGGPVVGVLLVAASRPVAGFAVLASALPVSYVLLRALHGLSRRWVVFVPAGLVLHDTLSLADPVLFQRKMIEVLRPAPADTDSLDLTKNALGLALELVLREKAPMVLAVPGRRGGEPGSSARLLFSPTRPGAVLREALSRRIPVE